MVWRCGNPAPLGYPLRYFPDNGYPASQRSHRARIHLSPPLLVMVLYRGVNSKTMAGLCLRQSHTALGVPYTVELTHDVLDLRGCIADTGAHAACFCDARVLR